MEDEQPPEDDSMNQKPKIKRPRKPRRSQLEDNYPPMIQVISLKLKPNCLINMMSGPYGILFEAVLQLIGDHSTTGCIHYLCLESFTDSLISHILSSWFIFLHQSPMRYSDIVPML